MPDSISALSQHPCRSGLDADLTKDRRDWDSGPLAAARPTVRLLDGLAHRSFRPLQEGIPGALQEVDHRDGREALEVVHREQHWTLDEPMHQQAMLRRVDRRDTTVVNLVPERIGGDHAVQILQWRKAVEWVEELSDDGLLVR